MDDDRILQTLRETFLEEAEDQLKKVELLLVVNESSENGIDSVDELLRIYHTLKGSAHSVHFLKFGSLAHSLESMLIAIKNSNNSRNDQSVMDLLLEVNDRFIKMINDLREDFSADCQVADLIDKVENFLKKENGKNDKKTSKKNIYKYSSGDLSKEMVQLKEKRSSVKNEKYIRLSSMKLDMLLDAFSEQVVLQSLLDHNKDALNANSEFIKKTINQLCKVTFDLQNITQSLRMIKVETFFHKIQRIARDTANILDKKVELSFEGGEIEIDKNISDELSDALTHIIRNAIDHGLEKSSQRLKKQKSEAGKISVVASLENNLFCLRIKDDGAGLDKNKIRKKAIDLKLLDKTTKILDNETYQFLFMPGFSTAKEVTAISGRGVGMDAVKTLISSVNGDIQVKSEKNIGTEFVIKIPVSMSVFNGTILQSKNEKFILMSTEIAEVFEFKDSEVKHLNNARRVIKKNNKEILLINAGNILQYDENREAVKDANHLAVLVHREGKDIALEVDEVLGEQRIILKKLGPEVAQIPGVAGGAILSDGNVALVFNLKTLDY